VTFTNPVQAGDTIAVALTWTGGNPAPSFFDNQGTAYQVAIDLADAGIFGNWATQLLYARVDSGTLSLTLAGDAGYPWLQIGAVEYSGVDPLAPLDAAVYGDGSDPDGGEVVGPSLQLTSAGDVIFAYFQVNTGATIPADNLTTLTSINGDLLEVGNAADAGTFPYVMPNSGFNNWLLVTAAFRATGAGGSSGPPGAGGDAGSPVSALTPGVYQVGCGCTASAAMAELPGLFALGLLALRAKASSSTQ
jgi:hypothetical protein